MATTDPKLVELEKYSACDIADALLKLDVPGAGFLPDIGTSPAKVVARATTVLFIPRSTPAFPAAASARGPFSLLNRALAHPLPNIPDGVPYADLVAATDGATSSEDEDAEAAPAPASVTEAGGATAAVATTEADEVAAAAEAAPAGERPDAAAPREEEDDRQMGEKGGGEADSRRPASGAGRIVVASQPRGQSCAVIGGIMATRLRRLGASGLCVDGRVRDLACLSALGLPVWSRGTSIVGAGAETKAWATDVPVSIGDAVVAPGDIVMLDPGERGAVSVPARLLDRVLEMIPRLVAADEKVIKDVEAGGTVAEAFRKYRGK